MYKKRPYIGLSYFSGIPDLLLIKMINHNAKFFDIYYILVDNPSEFKYLDRNVQLIYCSNEDLVDISLPFLSNKFKSSLKKMRPRTLSDLPFLYAKRILYYFNHIHEKVLYIDINLLITNKYLFKELFYYSEDTLYVKLSMGNYAYNNYKKYISGDFGLDCKSKNQDKKLDNLLKKWINQYNINSETVLGPKLLNDYNLKDCIKLTNIFGTEVDPRNLGAGDYNASIDPSSIGYSFSNTIMNHIDLEIRDFYIDENMNLKLKLKNIYETL